MVRPFSSPRRTSRGEWRGQTSGGRDALAHVNFEAAHERLLAIHRKAVPAIEFDVRRELLVRIELELRQAQRCCEPLRVVQQKPAVAASLKRGRHGQVLDEQMVGLVHGLDQRHQSGADVQQIDHVLAHRPLVVRRHGHGLAADQRNPFRISGPCQLPDIGRIGRTCPTDLRVCAIDRSLSHIGILQK